MNGRWRRGAGLAATLGVVVGLWVVASGCGTDRYSRSVEFTHWHDEETIVVVYTREKAVEGIFAPFRSRPETLHVRLCKVQEDNTVTCRHQRRFTNMVNDHVGPGDVELRDYWRE